MSSKEASKSKDKDKSKVHKLSLKGSARLVAEFVRLHKGHIQQRAWLTLGFGNSSNTQFIPSCMRVNFQQYLVLSLTSLQLPTRCLPG